MGGGPSVEVRRHMKLVAAQGEYELERLEHLFKKAKAIHAKAMTSVNETAAVQVETRAQLVALEKQLKELQDSTGETALRIKDRAEREAALAIQLAEQLARQEGELRDNAERIQRHIEEQQSNIERVKEELRIAKERTEQELHEVKAMKEKAEVEKRDEMRDMVNAAWNEVLALHRQYSYVIKPPQDKTDIQRFVSQRDVKNSRTPLHHAAGENLSNAALWLIRSGADVNATDHAGWTPLHVCAANGRVVIASMLLHAGANKSLRTSQHETAEMLARRMNNDSVLNALKSMT